MAIKKVINREEYPMVVDWSDYVNSHSNLLCKCQGCECEVYKSITIIKNRGDCYCVKCGNTIKKQKTCIERYGVPFHQQVPEIINKIKETNIEKYGITCSLHTNENQEKVKQTNLKKYGVENPFASKEVQEKIKETNIEKFGVEYIFQSKEIQEKIKKNSLEKYGFENALKSKEIQEKIKITCIEKYGFENALSSPTIKEKIRKTNLKKYGVKNLFALPIIQEKIKQTCLEKYGVPYYCMTEDCITASRQRISKINIHWKELLESLGYIITTEFNIGNLSYDLKIENTNILIEINPTYTHNSTNAPHYYNSEIKDKSYHYNKSLIAKQNGYRLIHVWDWDDQNKILNLINQEKNTIYARKCIIKEVGLEETNIFLNEWHLQGSLRVKNILSYGLYYNEELVMIITLGKPRYNKNYEYELLRLCSNVKIVGGVNKLFKYFLKEVNPKNIISYCDMSKFDGNIYKELGFIEKQNKPSKHWFNVITKQHITDNLLRQKGFDKLIGEKLGEEHCYGKGTDNNELMVNYGFVEIYDAGQNTYKYEKEN